MNVSDLAWGHELRSHASVESPWVMTSVREPTTLTLELSQDRPMRSQYWSEREPLRAGPASLNIQFSGDSGFPLNPKTLLCRRTLVSQNNSRRRTVAPNSFLKIRIFSALAPLKPELFTSSLVLYLFSSRLTSGYSKIRKAPWLHLPPTPIIGSWTEISPFKRMALLEHLASFHILFSLGRAV